MTEPEHDLGNLPFDPETLFKPEGLTYWLQYSSQDFVLSIVSEIRQEVFLIHEYAKLIHENTNAASVDLEFLAPVAEMTVGEVCEIFVERTTKLMDILDTAQGYASAQLSEDS